MSTVEV